MYLGQVQRLESKTIIPSVQPIGL